MASSVRPTLRSWKRCLPPSSIEATVATWSPRLVCRLAIDGGVDVRESRLEFTATETTSWLAPARSHHPWTRLPQRCAARLVPGPEGLDTLDGAFAAAWWDGERRRLTLIRDPFGVRSLYYTEHDGVFYFASELKQLLAIPESARGSGPGGAPQVPHLFLCAG